MVEGRACDKNIDYVREIRTGTEVLAQKLNTVCHRAMMLKSYLI